jgi:hypothetical protein
MQTERWVMFWPVESSTRSVFVRSIVILFSHLRYISAVVFTLRYSSHNFVHISRATCPPPRLTPSVAGFLLPVTSTWAIFLCLLQAFNPSFNHGKKCVIPKNVYFVKSYNRVVGSTLRLQRKLILYMFRLILIIRRFRYRSLQCGVITRTSQK